MFWPEGPPREQARPAYGVSGLGLGWSPLPRRIELLPSANGTSGPASSLGRIPVHKAERTGEPESRPSFSSREKEVGSRGVTRPRTRSREGRKRGRGEAPASWPMTLCSLPPGQLGKVHGRRGWLTRGGQAQTRRVGWGVGSEAGTSHLESVAGEPQAQLPADHHGLHNAPVLAAHRPPYEGPVPLHQHLHPALVGVSAPVQAQLWRERQVGHREGTERSSPRPSVPISSWSPARDGITESLPCASIMPSVV